MGACLNVRAKEDNKRFIVSAEIALCNEHDVPCSLLSNEFRTLFDLTSVVSVNVITRN